MESFLEIICFGLFICEVTNMGEGTSGVRLAVFCQHVSRVMGLFGLQRVRKSPDIRNSHESKGGQH